MSAVRLMLLGLVSAACKKYVTFCDVRELEFNKVLFDPFFRLADEHHRGCCSEWISIT